MDGGKPLLANPFFRRKVAELEVDLAALEFTELRTLAGERPRQGSGAGISLLKIKGTEIQQRLTELALEAAGHYGAPYFRSFGEGDNEHAVGPTAPPRPRRLFQHAQDQHLWRVERDPAQHHRQDGAGPLS
jgi:alkylation response protein AidB-like acyl-CoA dehydrogenase